MQALADHLEAVDGLNLFPDEKTVLLRSKLLDLFAKAALEGSVGEGAAGHLGPLAVFVESCRHLQFLLTEVLTGGLY